MNILRAAFAGSLAVATLALALPAVAQVGEGSCILAGRLADNQRWAPRMSGVELLAQDGRAITSADKQALASVRQVRLSAPALLSRCDGDGQLALGPESAGPKAPVPAIGPGVLPVVAVNFPKLRRGGEMVELKVTVPAERVSMVTR